MAPDAGFADETDIRLQQMDSMWNAHWYSEFEISNAIPDGARTFELACDGDQVSVTLLHDVAPDTCARFWELLPIQGHAIHCAFFGHAAFWLDRVDLGTGRVLENRSVRLTPGEFIWDPWMHEITWAYGRYAEMRFPTTLWYGDQPHPNQGCIFARVVQNDLDRFASMMKRLRYEGAKLVEARRPS
jgi:hypothetical protein